MCCVLLFVLFLRDVSVPNFLFSFPFLFSLPLYLLAFPFPGFLCLLAFLARNHLNFVLFFLCLWLTVRRKVNILCQIFILVALVFLLQCCCFHFELIFLFLACLDFLFILLCFCFPFLILDFCVCTCATFSVSNIFPCS